LSAVVPSSSEEEGVEKLTTKTVEVLRTEQPVAIRETRRFSETIAIDHRQKLQEMALQFKLPLEPRREKSEYIVRRESLPKGMKMEVRVRARVFFARRADFRLNSRNVAAHILSVVFFDKKRPMNYLVIYGQDVIRNWIVTYMTCDKIFVHYGN